MVSVIGNNYPACQRLGSILIPGLVLIGLISCLGCSDSDETVQPSSSIKLNEVQFAASADNEWVELHNPSSQSVDVGDLEITNGAGDTYTVPGDIPKVSAGGYVVIHFDGLGAYHNDYFSTEGVMRLHSDLMHGDVFNDTADTCTLYPASDSSNPSAIDFVAWGEYAHRGQYINNADEYGSYGPVEPNETIGVHPDVYSSNLKPQWVIYADDEGTPGALNAVPAPVLVVPYDDTTQRNDQISFAWRDWFVNVEAFHIEVDDADDFASPTITAVSESLRYQSDISLPDGTYYWRVKTITRDGEESSWSATHVFHIEDNVRGEVVGTKIIEMDAMLMRKDTSMLCPGCEENGDHSWNEPHAFEKHSKCPHCSVYCARACVAMINKKFGGKISQDRISYQIFASGLDPADQLGHGRGFNGAQVRDALAYALKGNTLGNLEDMSFTKIKEFIDEGRPIIGFIHTAADKHVVVINGYTDYGDDSKNTFHILQPYTGEPKPVAYKDTKISKIAAPPADSEGIVEDEMELKKDSDEDGVIDFDEERRFFSLPHDMDKDTDDDGLSDFTEIWSWVWGKGLELRRPFNGWLIWTRKNFDNDLNHDGEEDLNHNGTMDADECDPFVSEKPILLSLEVAGADGGSPKAAVNTTAVDDIGSTGSSVGYHARQVAFLWCGKLQQGQNSIAITALKSGIKDLYDDIQIRNIKVVDQNNNNTVLMTDPGPYHLGDNTIASIWEDYENGKWNDPNLPGFWIELHGVSIQLTFNWQPSDR